MLFETRTKCNPCESTINDVLISLLSKANHANSVVIESFSRFNKLYIQYKNRNIKCSNEGNISSMSLSHAPLPFFFLCEDDLSLHFKTLKLHNGSIYSCSIFLLEWGWFESPPQNPKISQMIHVFHPPILSQQDFMHVATYASLYFNIFIILL